MAPKKLELRELPKEVTTVGDFNDLAGGMVANLNETFAGQDGESAACLLARAMNPLCLELIATVAPGSMIERPGDLDRSCLVPEHLVEELMEFKVKMYDPYFAPPAQPGHAEPN